RRQGSPPWRVRYRRSEHRLGSACSSPVICKIYQPSLSRLRVNPERPRRVNRAPKPSSTSRRGLCVPARRFPPRLSGAAVGDRDFLLLLYEKLNKTLQL